MGAALHEQGLFAEACECYRRALLLRPDMAGGAVAIGRRRWRRRGRLDEAIERFCAVLVQMPNRAELHSNLGDARQKDGQLNEAICEYRRAIELNPNFGDAHNNLGTALKDQEEFAQAESCYWRAVELRPEFAEAHSNLATTLKEAGKLEEAIGSYRRGVRSSPILRKAAWNGNGAAGAGRVRGSGGVLRSGVALRPDFPEAHFSRAALKLLKGDFAEGGKSISGGGRRSSLLCESLFSRSGMEARLVGKTILLHAEQGLGDTLQFVRYAVLVKKLGGNVVFECPRGLVKLLASCEGIDRLVGVGDELPEFDVHAALMTLPAILGTTLATIPANVPYLFADRGLVELWRERLANVKGFRIGINWQGREGRGPYRRRDIPLERFERLAELPGVRLISLQKQGSRFKVQSSRFKARVQSSKFKVQSSR